MEYAIVTDQLVKTFGRGGRAVHALQGVSLEVARGEIFGLLGPNGAGKTTLIKCLLGIVFPTSGTGNLLGHPLASVAAKHGIGYLPENHRYPLHLTGDQVLNYFGKLSDLPASTLQGKIDEALLKVGMRDWRKTKVRKYSKGMMQRLGLAQALLNDPELIILDEPTDGVDPVGRKEIRDILTQLKLEGRTIFLNSHLLSEVERISDNVAIMRHGRIVKQGSVAALTSSGNLYEIVIADDAHDIARLLFGDAGKRVGAGRYDVHVGSISELNVLIDRLRTDGILIHSIQEKRSSLEDLFIDLIKSSDLTKE